MRLDGKAIAQKIFVDLKIKVEKLKEKGITPHLHIITLTTDSASNAYVSQKKLKGGEIGAKITVEKLNPTTKIEELIGKVGKLNNDRNVHGIIIQRPIPEHIDESSIANSINPNKDVDGFNPQSKFSPPVGEAVLEILREVYINKKNDLDFEKWLKSKDITVVGRGVTAGRPIIKTFEKMRIAPNVITSKTENRDEILKNSDIVICAVGRQNVIKKSDIKKGAILVGVGMFKGEDEKFHSDYKEDDIKDTASFYTPTPGGVGPVNVAMLLSNLVKTCKN